MKNRYITNKVHNEIPLDIQIILWGIWGQHSVDRNGNVDWLQVFEIKVNDDEYIIKHWSEQPKYSHEKHIPKKYLSDVDECKLYIIDDDEYATMLFPDER